ncbi:MAG: GAF domain-containing protein [Gaiellaceae bacterium MAG52_C11]|nr:GAF domain-containing protein [Candidatus Gaiellasilicea maunaloa]
MNPPLLNESTLPQLRGLLEMLRLQRVEQEPSVMFERIAAILGESLGFHAVVVNLYRPRWNDFQVVAAHGSDEARALLLGTTTTHEAWSPLLDDRFLRGGVFFIPHGELDWSAFGTVYLPEPTAIEAPDPWHPEDALIAPMRGADGSLLGILSLDDPESGAVPGPGELEVLATVAAHVALSIDAAQAAAVAARDRASLANLLEVSSRLNGLETVESVLGAVTRGIQQALGFEKVVAAIADGAGGFVPGGAAGWSLDDHALGFELTAAEIEAILDPDFEIEGCYLLPREVASPRVRVHSSYASVRNGRGPRAWNRHWLIVPLVDRSGGLIGFVWADDPEDSLLPSRERLQALRTFANQASAALRAAADLETLTRRNGELAALHRTTLGLLDRLDLDSVLESIVDSARSLLHTMHGYLYLLDDQGGTLQLQVRLGMFERMPTSVVARGEGVAGRVWETGVSLAVADYARWSGRLPQFEGAGFHAVLGVPLRTGGEVKGVLGLAYDDRDRSFGSSEVALLERFAQLASLALENAHLYSEVQRSEEMYRRVLENSHDLISLLDLEGRLTYANAAHERVLGYRVDELVGMHAADLADPDDPPLALRGRTPSLPIRRIRRKDGSWALLEGSSVLLRNPAGEPELTLVFARDVSERERVAEQLRQAQKLESIGLLAGGIAHDFNNLLTAIGGYAELGALELEAGEIETVRESIEQIQRASGRAAELTSQLLAFSRKQVLHPRELDLNEVISDMSSMVARLLGDDIVLSSALDLELGPVIADPTQIEQVLLNLAINARDAMPDGGSLSIRTSSLEIGGLEPASGRELRDLQPGSYVTLTVRDTGVGMDVQLAERIFEPFFTTKSVGEGTGLGLATVHGIVSQSGGSIWVESEPGSGTCFTVCLPRAA